MTGDELKAIEDRANAATPPPWSIEVDGVNDVLFVLCDHNCKPWNYTDEATDRDWAFINAARTDVPALVAEVQRLRGLVKQAEWADCLGDEAVCPWCEIEREGSSQHLKDCPAFTITGDVR